MIAASHLLFNVYTISIMFYLFPLLAHTLSCDCAHPKIRDPTELISWSSLGHAVTWSAPAALRKTWSYNGLTSPAWSILTLRRAGLKKNSPGIPKLRTVIKLHYQHSYNIQENPYAEHILTS